MTIFNAALSFDVQNYYQIEANLMVLNQKIISKK